MPQTKLHNDKINACIINNNKLCTQQYGVHVGGRMECPDKRGLSSKLLISDLPLTLGKELKRLIKKFLRSFWLPSSRQY